MKVIRFIKRNTVFCVAAFAALITCFFVPPDGISLGSGSGKCSARGLPCGRSLFGLLCITFFGGFRVYLPAGDDDGFSIVGRTPVPTVIFVFAVGSHGHLTKGLLQFLFLLFGGTGR